MSNKKWNNNLIQFARLISEMEAAGAFTEDVINTLCNEMDLEPQQIGELVDRAQQEWEKAKLN